MMALVDVEERIPANHPRRQIKTIADRVLAAISPTFDAMCAEGGRPSIPPERLLEAGLLMALYTARSGRAFCEELDYNLLYRWFLDMDMIAPGFDASPFSKNRERLLAHDVARIVFDAVVTEADRDHLLSTDYFSLDGTMIAFAASMKSVHKRDGDPTPPDDPSNPEVSFRNERRRNATHASTTDPEARLYRKGKGQAATLAFLGHALVENRYGLLVDITVTTATRTAERDAALAMIDRMRERGGQPVSLGADKSMTLRASWGPSWSGAPSPHHAERLWHRKGPTHECSLGGRGGQPGLPDQSTKAEADRRGVRLDEVDRGLAADLV